MLHTTLPGFDASLPTGIEAAALRFDPKQFEHSDFARTGIACPAELTRAAPQRRAEFLAGRLCAREALGRLTGAAQVPGRAEDRSPRWPEGIVGSISHAGQQAIAVAASRRDYRALGVDIEKPLSAELASGIAPMVASNEEIARLGALEPALGITLAFSVKESLYKALYPAIGRYIDWLDAEVIDCEHGHLGLHLKEELDPAWPRDRLISAHWGYGSDFLWSLVAIPAGG